MKSKASYFSLSMPLIKENLRRFWAIPVISFLGYFLSSTFPILMSYKNTDNIYSYIEKCLTNNQPVFMILHLILPVITAVVIFKYLQNASSVTAIHSMPFTRAQLYNSNILSGLILIVTPLLANELTLQIIAKPTYDRYMYVDMDKMTTLGENAVNIFSRMNVLNWFWESLLIILVIYAISVFTGMVTGNAVMHLALSFGFNFLMPALYLTFLTYCSSYLFGFTISGIHENILSGLSPFTEVFVDGGDFPGTLQGYYMLLTIVLFCLSAFLYKKRKLEKAGDAMVFPFMIPIISYLITFFGMTLMGFYFSYMGYFQFNNESNMEKETYFYAGLLAGTVIFFILGRMIVLKTPRIFDKSLVKNFGIYAVIATIFVTSITFDLTGFEGRIPNQDSVLGVKISNFAYTDDKERYQSNSFRDDRFKSKSIDFRYTDPENLKNLTALHRNILDKKEALERKNLNENSFQVQFDYHLAQPFGMQRSYTLGYSSIKDSKYFKTLYESSAFKTHFSLNNLDYEKISSIKLENTYYYTETEYPKQTITDSKEMDGLLAALDADFKKRTFEEYISLIHPYCAVNLNYKYRDENDKLLDSQIRFNVLLSDTNTIKWLEENGTSQILSCNADMVDRIIFERYDYEEAEKPASIVEDVKQTLASEETQMVITDKKQIQEILDTYCTSTPNYNKLYRGNIIMKQSTSEAERYANEIYYSFENAPPFIKEYYNKP